MKHIGRILIHPDIRYKTNKYLENLTKTIDKFYQVDGYYSIKSLGIKNILSYNVYHMNWYENIHPNKKIKGFIKKVIFLFMLKLLGKKTIWTIHNRESHRTNIYSKFLFFLLKKMSSKIHILCFASIRECNLQKYKRKITCIPHGDYFGNYPESNFNIFKHYSISTDCKIMSFIGRISPYKNIELLIESFEKSNMPENNWQLLICGEAISNNYQTEIEALISNKKNIIMDFNFIQDDKISSYLTQSSLLIAPYNKKSSLNSGTLWLACSYSKTMILPNIGCVRDLPNRDDFLYIYDYETKGEHLDNLVKTLNRVNEDSQLLEEKGKMAHKVMEANSWENNKEKWKDLFSGFA